MKNKKALPQPNLLRKMSGHQAITFKEGSVLIWGWPAIIYPMTTSIFFQKLLEDRFGRDTRDILYYLGKIQGKIGGNIMYDKFGFNRGKQGAALLTEHSQLVGLGIQKFAKFDLKNKQFIHKYQTMPYAKQYRKLFGLQKEPVDHFIRGILAGSHEPLIQKGQLVCIETSCFAMGKTSCIFEIKEKEKWDLSNKFIANQFPKEIKLDIIKKVANITSL